VAWAAKDAFEEAAAVGLWRTPLTQSNTALAEHLAQRARWRWAREAAIAGETRLADEEAESWQSKRAEAAPGSKWAALTDLRAQKAREAAAAAVAWTARRVAVAWVAKDAAEEAAVGLWGTPLTQRKAAPAELVRLAEEKAESWQSKRAEAAPGSKMAALADLRAQKARETAAAAVARTARRVAVAWMAKDAAEEAAVVRLWGTPLTQQKAAPAELVRFAEEKAESWQSKQAEAAPGSKWTALTDRRAQKAREAAAAAVAWTARRVAVA